MSEPPQCRTNVSLPNNAIDVSDFLEITCSVSHIGSWIPVFVCAPGLPGRNSTSKTSSTRVSYRRAIAASDIADFAVLSCTVTFTPDDTHDSSSVFAIPPDADVPDFDFIWSTSAIRVIKPTGRPTVFRSVKNFSLYATRANQPQILKFTRIIKLLLIVNFEKVNWALYCIGVDAISPCSSPRAAFLQKTCLQTPDRQTGRQTDRERQTDRQITSLEVTT